MGFDQGKGGIFYLNLIYETRLHHCMGVLVRNHFNSISMKDIISQLAEHDWYYFMSDDPSNYRRGEQSEQKLRNELMKYELSHIISRLDILKERVTKMYQQK